MTPAIETAPPPAGSPPGPQQWRGLEEYMDTPAFRDMLHREFPEDSTEWTDPVSRRQFMTLMGASLALAGVVGCSPRPAPNRKIVPYVNQPEGITPGVPNYFATAALLSGVATGILVKSYEGRPVKIEGNPSHPGSKGGADAITQASILNLYDPDRSQTLTKNGITAMWEDALRTIRAELEKQKSKKGAGVRFLSETITSPTFIAQMDEFKKLYPDSKWVQFDPISRENVRKGTTLAFGKSLNPIYDFTKADVVLSIDSDFTHDGAGAVRYARDFMSRRKVRENKKDGGSTLEMNRLYVVEAMPTPTGSVADHRLAIRNSDMENFLRALASELAVAGVPKPSVELSGAAKEWIKPLAKDLKLNEGKSLVVVGDTQPPAVHALAYAINAALKNTDKTLFFTKPLEGDGATNQLADLTTLVDEMKGSKVDLLFVLDANPVYSAPANLAFLEAFKKVPTRVHLGLYVDETSQWANWHIPGTHSLETWSDARAYDGTVTILQPLIAPLYAGKSCHELLNELVDVGDSTTAVKSTTPLEIVRRYWSDKLKNGSDDFNTAWQRSIREGVIRDSAFTKESVTLKADWATGLPPKSAPAGLEISFRADPTLYDGRFANNGWLQELPKPVTKICWDNVLYLSPRTAKNLKIDYQTPKATAGEHGRAEVQTLEIEYKGRKVKGPVWILPGHADDVITVHLGFGREVAGKVALGGVYEKFDVTAVGFDAFKLRTSDALWFDVGLKAGTAQSEGYLIACTQTHHNMEGRKAIRYAKVLDYAKDKQFAKILPNGPSETGPVNELLPGPGEHQSNGKHEDHDHKEGEPKHEHQHDSRLVPLTMLPATNKEGRRWAMAIDLTSCNGCSACLIACQSENNIPVVGKEQVTRGREMHWIRIDRYYEVQTQKDVSSLKPSLEDVEDPNNLVTLFQPVPCQQCEKAPCEVVCPVAATVHSADGLNDMIYNRCVGTRYCSNNCPYKVRRFNFLTFADFATETLKLVRNPEVTLRSRGVMEKCTYCVQRIRSAEIEAEREWHEKGRPKDEHGRPQILDGEIVTACQAACPSAAIVFGDLSDSKSAVNRWKSEPTNYGLLAELNTMPRTTYLATLRNPNPDMPKSKGA